MRKLYEVWAGEGERLRYVAGSDTLQAARGIMERENCSGQRNVMLKLRTETGEYMRVQPYSQGLPEGP